MLAVIVSTAAPSAAAAPPTLTGETLTAQSNYQTTSEPAFLALCAAAPPVAGAGDYTATQTFSFNGTATGPLPGTFTESGSITTTFPPGFLPPGYTGTVQAFSASFRITSPAGTVTGTKSMTLTGQAAQCGGGAGGTTFSAEPTANFTAAITTAAGSYQDHGTSTVDLGSAWQYANVSYATLSESFISAPVNTGLPTIAGTPTQGQLLSASDGAWTGSPTSYGYWWQRCNATGSNCASIAGATSQTYTLTSADVGSTIRVQESAANAGGSGGPVTSNATTVIEAPAGNPPAPPSPPDGTHTTSGTPSIPGVVQIRAQLLGQLIPCGAAASIGAVLRHGGYSFWFRARTPGRVSISWYYLPWTAESGNARSRAVLVATGAAQFAAAGLGKLSIRLTANGRRKLRSARSLRLNARGTYTPTGMPSVSAARTITLRR